MVEKKKTVAELAWHPTSVSPLLWGAGQATTVLQANWGCCGKSSDAIITCNKLMNWTKYEKKRAEDKLQGNSDIDWTHFFPAASLQLC